MQTIPAIRNIDFKNWIFVCISTVIVVGVLVIAGWQFDIERIKYPIPGLVGMNPITALSFIVLGIAFLLFFLRRPGRTIYIVYILSILVIIIGIYKLTASFIP